MAINYVNIREHLIRLFEINFIYYSMWWKILIGIYVVGAIWLIYEAWSAPTYPDDYDKDYPN